MYFREICFTILVFQINFIHSQSETDVLKYEPVDVLQLKHVVINNYNGPLNEEVLHLFKNVKTLELKDSIFPSFVDTFYLSVPELEKITLTNCIIHRVEANISHCCRHLEEVNLINSSLPEMPWHQIGKEWPIKKLFLHKENVPELRANILTDVKLKELTIKQSGLKIIDEGAFNDLHELDTLNLDNNQIETLDNRILKPLKNLKYLNLSYNLLKKLTTDDFPYLPILEEINIGHNPITKINLEGITKFAPQLKKVDISGIEGVDVSNNGGVTFVKNYVA